MVNVENIDSVIALERMYTRHPSAISVVLFYRLDLTGNQCTVDLFRQMANSVRAEALARGPRPVFFALHDLNSGNGQLQDRYGGPDLPLTVIFRANPASPVLTKIAGMDMEIVLHTVQTLCASD